MYDYIANKDVGFDYFIDYNDGARILSNKEILRKTYIDFILKCIEGGSAGIKIGGVMKSYIYDLNKELSIIKQAKLSIILSFSLIVFDVLDVPSKIIVKYSPIISLLILLGILIFLLLTLIEIKFLDMLKMPTINYVDVIVCIKLISILVYFFLIYLTDEMYQYKLIFLGSLFILASIVGIIRIHRYSAAKKQSKEYQSNIVDLKDLYEGKLKEIKQEPVLLEEKDVDYDLLNRDRIINHLYNSIILTNPKGKFVISLEGKWGSGKTTIIRNVKRKINLNNEEIIIIDEFDPWIYGDEKTLLLNMLNLIIRKSGFKYSNLFTEKIAENLSELVLGANKSGLIKSIFFEQNSINIKSKINNYLKMSGKKYVFFIDNIDRAERDNVVLLFKLVGSILDFERITYVLSFDDKRVEEIFKRDFSIDYEYLKKIINLPIRVPEIDKIVLENLYSTSIKNILAMYGETEENLNEYDSFIKFICNNRLDIRDFKRFINSAVNFSFKEMNYLHKKDILIIEYIKMFNFPLYKAIYENSKYFISYDLIHNNELYKVTFNRKEFNLEGKDFFIDLFKDSDNENYREILGEIFSYVNKFNSSQELVYTGEMTSKDPDYLIISKLRRISSAKYFDLYFTETSNAYVEIGFMLENLVKEMNKIQSFTNKELLFKEMLNSVHYSYHKEVFERLQFYVDDLDQENIDDFVRLLFDNVEFIDDSREFVALSARRRVEIIIHILLNKIADNEYLEFLESSMKKYNRIMFLQNLLYWFNNDNENINVDGRKELLEETIEKIAEDILKNNINLYENANYLPKNIWGIYHSFKEEQDKIKRYIKAIISEENIFRFLNDIINVSVGSVYTYYISREGLENFIDQDYVDSILNRVQIKTSDEQFVLDVYRAYDKDVSDEWGDSGIKTNHEKKLEL